LENEYNIDPARIFANGLSNGGGMSFLLSCRLSERIAAIATVSGAYLLPWEDCHPARPVPLIAFHGTSDPIVPYQGGPSHAFDLPFPAIPEWIETYARRSGCVGEPTRLPASGEVSGIQYSNSTQNMDVTFYTVEGGGHSWPGGGYMPKFIVGHITQDIDGTQTIWDFFLNTRFQPVRVKRPNCMTNRDLILLGDRQGSFIRYNFTERKPDHFLFLEQFNNP